MFPGLNERELFCGEIWSIWQRTKLPQHLELLVEQEQGKRDIWEYESQETVNRSQEPKVRSQNIMNY